MRYKGYVLDEKEVTPGVTRVIFWNENHFREDNAAQADSMDKAREEIDFIESCRPLMEYLAKNHHPHIHVFVTSTTAELLEGCKVYNTDEFLTDRTMEDVKKSGRIEHEGFTYWYEYRPAKNGEICLGTKDPEKYCNGVYRYSQKDPGDGMAFVVTDTDNIDLIV